jgi:PAS domain-containing protein
MPDNTNRIDFLESLIDAVPAMLLVVDDDVRILEYNREAAALLGEERRTVLKYRCGEPLHCIHSTEVPEGCGRAESCKTCVIRNAVKEAFAGQSRVRRRIKLERVRDGQRTNFFGLINASPFTYNDVRMVLLTIEDISEILELHRITPICAKCKKVRDDDQYWMKLETYFKRNWDLDFSHGLCPTCAEEEIARLDRDI